MYVRRAHSRWKHLDFILIDLCVMEVAFALAYYIRHRHLLFGFGIYWEMALVLLVFHFLFVFFLEPYRDILKRSRLMEIKKIGQFNAIVFAAMMGYMLFRKNTGEYSRFVLITFLVLVCVGMYIAHEGYKEFLRKRKVNEWKKQYLLLVTDSDQANDLIRQIRENEFGVTRLYGVILLDKSAVGSQIDGIPVVAGRETMYEYAKMHVVDEVLISTRLPYEEILDGFACMGITVHINLEHLLHREKGMLNYVNGVPVFTTCIHTVTNCQLFIKRAIDILIGIFGVFATAIACLIFGPIIYIQSPGPIFFTQERVGKNGRRFRIIKFRSMYVDAEERKKELMAYNEMQGLMFKMTDDPRITSIGRFLRRTSIDELPQFINILQGKMSLVGTRPPTLDEYEQYDLIHKSRLATMPGLTGMWQISGRSQITDFDEVVRLDNEYIKNWSLGMDLKIIWKTIGVVLGRSGAK